MRAFCQVFANAASVQTDPELRGRQGEFPKAPFAVIV
jgi:hypothetical protein